MGKNILVAHGGGPTAVINCSLQGVVEAARSAGFDGSIYAARFGAEGILAGDLIDLTNVPIHMKEILFAKVKGVQSFQIDEVFRIAEVFSVQVVDIGEDSVLLECKLTERRNNELIGLLNSKFHGNIEIVRGGAVAIEAISTSCR